MSKFAILGTLANVAATIGVATPMGVEINKVKRDGWYGHENYVSEGRSDTVSEEEYRHILNLYNTLCYPDFYKDKSKIRSFCIADVNDQAGTGKKDNGGVGWGK